MKDHLDAIKQRVKIGGIKSHDTFPTCTVVWLYLISSVSVNVSWNGLEFPNYVCKEMYIINRNFFSQDNYDNKPMHHTVHSIS